MGDVRNDVDRAHGRRLAVLRRFFALRRACAIEVARRVRSALRFTWAPFLDDDLPVNPSDRLKGARVGGYEIVGVIGHGATASVYEAVHVALGKSVAIKVLHEHVANEPQV